MKQDIGRNKKRTADSEKRPSKEAGTPMDRVREAETMKKTGTVQLQVQAAAAAKAPGNVQTGRRIIRLEAGEFTDKKKAHGYLQRSLGFPAYYGNNLDALYDCLGDLDKAIVVELPQVIQDEAHLGEYGKTMLQVFRDAAAGNSLLELRIK